MAALALADAGAEAGVALHRLDVAVALGRSRAARPSTVTSSQEQISALLTDSTSARCAAAARGAGRRRLRRRAAAGDVPRDEHVPCCGAPVRVRLDHEDAPLGVEAHVRAALARQLEAGGGRQADASIASQSTFCRLPPALEAETPAAQPVRLAAHCPRSSGSSPRATCPRSTTAATFAPRALQAAGESADSSGRQAHQRDAPAGSDARAAHQARLAARPRSTPGSRCSRRAAVAGARRARAGTAPRRPSAAAGPRARSCTAARKRPASSS